MNILPDSGLGLLSLNTLNIICHKRKIKKKCSKAKIYFYLNNCKTFGGNYISDQDRCVQGKVRVSSST